MENCLGINTDAYSSISPVLEKKEVLSFGYNVYVGSLTKYLNM